MSQAEPHPFVPHHGHVDTTRPPDAESAAIARKRIENGERS